MTLRKTQKEKITEKAVALLEKKRESYRYSVLIDQLKQHFPRIPINSIHGTVWDLHSRLPDQVIKPSRGLFLHRKFASGRALQTASPTKTKLKEEDFYQPFADWLVNEMEECTKAIPLGRNAFKDKWGTPDVVGKREQKKTDLVQAPTEVVSAEIKFDTN